MSQVSVAKPLFVRVFLKSSAASEEARVEQRGRLLAGLSGRVIEVGAGHGLNFQYYPETVEEVLAVEPEETLRGMAEEAAHAARVPVRVVAGVADELPAADGEFDAAVASLVLCSVPDQAAALRELRRALRPDGELRFLEHVRARDARLARVQGVINVVWPRIGGGCNLNRETAAAIEDAGFRIEHCRRFDFAARRLNAPAKPHILGMARRP